MYVIFFVKSPSRWLLFVFSGLISSRRPLGFTKKASRCIIISAFIIADIVYGDAAIVTLACFTSQPGFCFSALYCIQRFASTIARVIKRNMSCRHVLRDPHNSFLLTTRILTKVSIISDILAIARELWFDQSRIKVLPRVAHNKVERRFGSS